MVGHDRQRAACDPLWPADGLDVGSDEGGAVGPYSTPNKFAGTIEFITIELDAK